MPPKKTTTSTAKPAAKGTTTKTTTTAKPGATKGASGGTKAPAKTEQKKEGMCIVSYSYYISKAILAISTGNIVYSSLEEIFPSRAKKYFL